MVKVMTKEKLEPTPIKDNLSSSYGKGARILIVDNESKYMADLKTTVEGHVKKYSKGGANVDTVLVGDAINKLKENAPYDAVILSGSFKRRYDNQEVQDVIKFVDDYNNSSPNKQTELYGVCLGHQALIHYHAGKDLKHIELGKYVKGDKEITLVDGDKKVMSHKHHKHAFDEAPNLEVIANSLVTDAGGTEHKIVEAVKHKSKPYSSSQGHAARKGHAQDMLYDMLNRVYQRAK